jgi:hypothetical protein
MEFVSDDQFTGCVPGYTGTLLADKVLRSAGAMTLRPVVVQSSRCALHVRQSTYCGPVNIAWKSA